MSGMNTPEKSVHSTSRAAIYNATTTHTVSHVALQLGDFMKYKAEMQKLGDGNKSMIMARQAEIVRLLSDLIAEYESTSSSRVESVRAHQIESFRSTLLSLQAELRKHQDELPKTEKMLIARREMSERDYNARVAEFQRTKELEEQSIYSKRESLTIQLREHDDLEGRRRIDEQNMLEQARLKISQEQSERIHALRLAYEKRIQDLEADRNSKWQQLQQMRAKLEEDRRCFDISIGEKIGICSDRTKCSKADLLARQQEWETGIHTQITQHEHSIESQIQQLRDAAARQHADFEKRLSAEITVLLNQKADVEAKVMQQRQALAAERLAWEEEKRRLEADFHIHLTEERNKYVNLQSSDITITIRQDIDLLEKRKADILIQITNARVELENEIRALDTRRAEIEMEGRRKIAEEDAELMRKFEHYKQQLESQIIQLDQHQYAEEEKFRIERANLQQLKAELELKMAEWIRIKEIVGAAVEGWTPITELNVRGEEMCVPSELLHRYTGSKMHKFFNQANSAEWNMADGRIFLERDPRIFRMVLDFIRTWGTLNLESLRLTSDHDLFMSELNYWGIGLHDGATLRQNRGVSTIHITGTQSPNQQYYYGHKSDASVNLTTPKVTLNLNSSPAPITTHIDYTSGFRGSTTYQAPTAPPTYTKTTYEYKTAGSDVEARAIANVVDSLWGNYDVDGNGQLDREESARFIQSCVRALAADFGASNSGVSSDAINQAFGAIDTDHSGMIDKQEMGGVILKLLSGGTLA